jgi:serine/threonine-protein kinase ATR
MNVVLLRLVEYLGHTNPLICGVAYDEVGKIPIIGVATNVFKIQKLTKCQSFEAMRLFMPYWRTIAPNVVKDLLRRPQVAQHLSDLLAMSVPEFLCLTQVYTIPFLVLTKKRDILQKIADACDLTIMPLCMDHNNMAAILSCILLQAAEDTENLIMALFNAASPDFNQIDHVELIRAEPILTASELLKAASEDNPSLKSRVSTKLLCFVRSLNL